MFIFVIIILVVGSIFFDVDTKSTHEASEDEALMWLMLAYLTRSDEDE